MNPGPIGYEPTALTTELKAPEIFTVLEESAVLFLTLENHIDWLSVVFEWSVIPI